MLLRLAGVAISVGLADSLNPSTVGPALYLATTRRRVARVALFTLGVFGANLIFGIAATAGPGKLLIALIPHPQRTLRHVIELIAGVVLIGVAVALWAGRRRLARRELSASGGGGGGSALLAGASIAAVEFPTAIPYFAVIAAIVASTASVPQAVGLLALYGLAFVAPLLVIVAILVVAGERADATLQRWGDCLQRRWPVVLAALLLLVGGGLTVLGAKGLLGR